MYKPEVFSYCKKNLNNTELYDLSRILSISLDYVKNPAKKNMFVCERVSYEVVMPLWNRNMIDFILNDFMITNLILKHFNKRMNYD